MSSPLGLPPLRRTARDAEAFARHVHADQVDKAGRPYVEHLERVMMSAAKNAVALHGFDFYKDEARLDEIRQIAWLHDVIEDTSYDRHALLAEGFPGFVVGCVEYHLTKPQGVWSYAEWIGWLAENAPLPALIVKIADTEDNADPARLALLDEATRDRLTKKYAASLPILRAAAEGRRT